MKRPMVPILASPGFTGAVALLMLNDHVLKRSAPGVVTGKLSDFAGIVVVAVLLRCVVRNDVAAVVLTTVGFVILKSERGAAMLAARVLGGVTLQDQTDLLALSVLVPVYLWFRHRRERPATRTPPIAILQVPALVLAVMATTATSCDEPARVDQLVTDGGTVWAGIAENVYGPSGEESEQVRWARSDDGGRSWEQSEPPASGLRATGEVCDSAHCWRTLAEERVEVDNGNGWEPAFFFTGEQWRQQELATSSGCDFPRDDTFGSIAVLDGEPATVLVTMGTQGVLRYDGESWERIGVLDRVPAAMPGPSWMSAASAWTLLGLAATSLVLIAGAFQRVWLRPRQRWFTAAAIAGTGAIVLLMVEGGLLFFASRFYPVWSALGVGLAVGVFIASVINVARPLRPLPPPNQGSAGR